MRWFAVAFLVLMGVPATAQTLDCTNAISQVEMTGCAAQAYDRADVDLNAAWKVAMAMARQLDGALQSDQIKTSTILRDAQRSWIPFRDKACEAESLLARGGSLQNQIFYECLTRLTQARTRDLRLFGLTN